MPDRNTHSKNVPSFFNPGFSSSDINIIPPKGLGLI